MRPLYTITSWVLNTYWGIKWNRGHWRRALGRISEDWQCSVDPIPMIVEHEQPFYLAKLIESKKQCKIES